MSPNFSNGRTKNISNLLKEQLYKYDNNINFNNIDLYNIKMKNCIGCSRCFQEGSCILDEEDYIGHIKNLLLDSDIIIFSTPVYLKTIPCRGKEFLERISMWAHTMELSGKYLIIIITATSNGLDETLRYLFDIASFMGLMIIGAVTVNVFDELKNIVLQLQNSIENILLVTRQDSNIYVNERLKKVFDDYKYIYRNHANEFYEYKIWKKRGYLEMVNYDDVIKNYKKRRKNNYG